MDKIGLYQTLQCSLKEEAESLLDFLCANDEKMNVLYIDDDIKNLKSFKRSSRDSFKLFTAQNTNEAIDVMTENEISLVICDYKLPSTNGIDLCKNIGVFEKNIPLVVVTGYEKEVIADDVFIKNNVEIIPKPFNINDILSSHIYLKTIKS